MFRLFGLLFVGVGLTVTLLWHVATGTGKTFMDVQRQYLLKGKKGRQTHGDAAFATLRDLKKTGHTAQSGFLIATLDKTPIYAGREASVCILGPRGAGKSMNMGTAVRNLPNANMFFVDPGGSQYRAHKAWLEAQGYEVGKIDLRDPLDSLKLDPMSYLLGSNPFQLAYDADDLAFLAVKQEQANSTSQHFLDLTRNLLASAILHEFVHNKKGHSLGYIATRLSARGAKGRSDYVSEMLLGIDPDVSRGAMSVEEAGKNERGSIGTTIANKYKPWTNKAISHLSTAPGYGWTWEEWLNRDKPQALFIIPSMKRNSIEEPYVRAVVGTLFLTVMREFERTGKPLSRMLASFIDEADIVGDCTPMVQALNVLRKANVNLMYSYLTPSQIEENFSRKDASALLTGSEWVIMGGMKDAKFYNQVAELIGKKTEQSRSESKTDHGTSEGAHDTGVPLISGDQLRRLPYTELVALVGQHTIRADKPWAIVNGQPVYR